MSSQRAYTEDDYRRVVDLTDEGASLAEIVAMTGISKRTVARMRNGQWSPPAGPSMPLLGRSPLTGVIEDYMDRGATLDELTVLARDNDPFRQDRDEGHKLGRWLRATLEDMGFAVGEDGRKIHNRGLHYLLIGQRKPDGQVYENNERTWKWLSDRVSKAARWLGYIPFTQVTDERNAEPVIRILPAAPQEQILPGNTAGDLPLDAEWYLPQAHLEGGGAIQPFRLAVVGEKSSLEPVLGPVAEQFGADLYLPTGEISDTQLHLMASLTAAEQRPVVVFYFADCDPSGWQMGISVARKLQALSELLGGFEFEVHRVALTPDTVRAWRLPSTPLKPKEKRAPKWQARTGTRQTEIDALAALRPGDLARIAREAIAPFFDETLEDRTEEAVQDWLADAQETVDNGLDGGREQIMAAAEGKFSRARALIEEVRASFETSTELDDLDEFVPPDADVPAGHAFAQRYWHDPGQQPLGLRRAVPGSEEVQGVRRGRGRGRGLGGVMSNRTELAGVPAPGRADKEPGVSDRIG
jgi:hypothetical protein